jgi:hypothetical protein
VNNNNNNNNNNNPSTQTTDEQNHLLEFFIYDVTHERNLNVTIDANDKRLIIFYNISKSLYSIGIRNGKLFSTSFVVLMKIILSEIMICYLLIHVKIFATEADSNLIQQLRITH